MVLVCVHFCVIIIIILITILITILILITIIITMFFRAVTVHKSQGTTLSRAELMINNAFDFGQAYVALSRVRSLEGLWLAKSIQPQRIKANPLVAAFYAKFSPQLPSTPPTAPPLTAAAPLTAAGAAAAAAAAAIPDHCFE